MLDHIVFPIDSDFLGEQIPQKKTSWFDPDSVSVQKNGGF